MSSITSRPSDNAILPQTAPEQRWQQAWRETDTRLRSTTRAAAATAPVVSRSARVNKLDADLLDTELSDMLREPVTKALSLLKPGLIDTYRLEVDTLIRALLFWLSVGSHRRATYGQALQNLTYKTSNNGRLGWRIHLFGIVSIGGGYLWTQITKRMSYDGWADAPRKSLRNRLWRLASWMERMSRLAALANLLAFFSAGQYKSVVERLLGLRLVNARPQLSHSVSFEFLNRQLVWHAFTEFVMFALPLVNPARARAWVVRSTRSLLRLPQISIDPKVAELPGNVCAICYTDADKQTDTQVDLESCVCVNPYITECGHRFCYVCVKTQMMAEGDEFVCLRCGCRVTSICAYSET
ncbi:peroxisome assembly protein (Peroxin-2) [Coemansia sp. RSA 485]|nr:peroxisome assembly protein (Peroxin-2) [Coemansia sp. RSA 485]